MGSFNKDGNPNPTTITFTDRQGLDRSGEPGVDFSFSGLKTAVMLKVREAEASQTLEGKRADIAASFQRATVDTLVQRTLKAAVEKQADRLVISGGVSANKLLRSEFSECLNGTLYYPALKFCTDNGAMIAVAGALRLEEAARPDIISAAARWSLETLSQPKEEGATNG